MNFRLCGALVSCLAVLGWSGCSGEPRPGFPSPKAAMMAMAEAAHAVEKDAFVAAFSGSDEWLDAMAAQADYMVAADRFRRKFIETYGHSAWQTFQGPRPGPSEANVTLDFMTDEKLDALQTLEIDAEGDEARVTFAMDGETVRWTFTRSRRGWLMQASSMVPSGTKPAAFAQSMRALVEVITKYESAIGHPGITPEDIDVELARAMTKVATGITTAKPHRFDIDRLR